MKPINAGMDAKEYEFRLGHLSGQQQFEAIRGHGRAMRRTFKGVMPRGEARRMAEAARPR